MKHHLLQLAVVFVLLGCQNESGDANKPSPGPYKQASQGFVEDFLSAHNHYRQEVGVADLSWSQELAQVADGWAQQLADRGCRSLVHSASEHGENLYAVFSGQADPIIVSNAWGAEKANYDHATNTSNGVTGHYTQMVWRETSEIGCAMRACSNAEVWVCNYSPAGNVNGRAPY